MITHNGRFFNCAFGTFRADNSEMIHAPQITFAIFRDLRLYNLDEVQATLVPPWYNARR